MSGQQQRDPCAHEHDFDVVNPLAERRTRAVVMLTAVTMLVELVAGWWYGSMALLADGWHMSSHVIALGLAVAAYTLARRLRHDARFAFGTWKIEVLGGYTSALLLAGVVLAMGYECVTRLMHPVAIAYDQALLVAVLGLLVNVASAWLLVGAAHGTDPAHGHGHDHGGAHDHRHADLNLRSAYIHVAADAATSLLAIAALAGGKYLHVGWLDAGVGLLGSVVVAAWAVSLLRSTARLLLDADMDAPIVAEIRHAVRDSALPAELEDLHVWRVGKGRYACILSVTAGGPATPAYFRSLLRAHPELVHVTVEVNPPAVA
ncbi:MAG TPA: CDF family Co(II)/Ni(II) efflux transporter DmeF [Steroidobacteraceae bacterium]|nr:CDF family Co(II)/Ni(II) efflux transporter DmeF [Steroidobacteraceae bacterium]